MSMETLVLVASGCFLLMGLIEFFLPIYMKKRKVKNESHKETTKKNHQGRKG